MTSFHNTRMRNRTFLFNQTLILNEKLQKYVRCALHYSKFLFAVNKVNITDDLIIVEAPEFGVSALSGHSHDSWYKGKGSVSCSCTLVSAQFLLEQLRCEALSHTHESRCGVLLSLHADPVCKSSGSVWCARPGLCLGCFSSYQCLLSPC